MEGRENVEENVEDDDTDEDEEDDASDNAEGQRGIGGAMGPQGSDGSAKCVGEKYELQVDDDEASSKSMCDVVKWGAMMRCSCSAWLRLQSDPEEPDGGINGGLSGCRSEAGVHGRSALS